MHRRSHVRHWRGIGWSVVLLALTAGCGGPAGPGITVVVEGTVGSAQVPQGAGEVTIDVLGSGLEETTSFSVGEFAASDVATTATGVIGVIDVPHAALIGFRNLELVTPAGQILVANAVQVTAITVAPDGNDGSGRGTPNAPFRTLTRALQAAATGDTIELRDGTYDTGLGGEAYPLDVSGLTVRGESRDGTILDGAPPAPATPGAPVGLVINAGETGLHELTLRGFESTALEVFGGDVLVKRVKLETSGHGVVLGVVNALTRPAVVLDEVDVSDNLGDGVRIRDADVTIRSSQLRANLDDNLDVKAEAVVLIEDSVLSDAGDANAEIGGSAVGSDGHWFDQMEVTFLRSTITAAGRHGLVLDSYADVTIQESTVTSSDRDNVRVRGDASVTILASFLTNGGDDGVDHESTGALLVRDTKIQNNLDDGVDIGGSPSSVDLGRAVDPGGNVVTGNVQYQLTDERADFESVVVTAHGNDFGAPVSGLKIGPDGDGFVWRIVGEDNAVDFGP
jgi:hypothetical protein